MTISKFVIAAGISLATFSSLQAAPLDGRHWLSDYYRDPRPDQLVQATIQLTQSGYFSSPREDAIAMGFFTTVFRQNPAWVDSWLNDASHLLPDHEYRILVVAAWQSGNVLGARRMRELAVYTSPDIRASVTGLLARGPVPVADVVVASQEDMNLQWGAYLASGDSRYILNILAALGSNRPGLAANARFELAQDAAADAQVMAICRDQLTRQPREISTQIEAALSSALPRAPGS